MITFAARDDRYKANHNLLPITYYLLPITYYLLPYYTHVYPPSTGRATPFT